MQKKNEGVIEVGILWAPKVNELAINVNDVRTSIPEFRKNHPEAYKNFMVLMAKEREPRFTHCGIYIHEYKDNNVVGDTAWDCDWGDMKWNGTEWKSYNRKNS